MRRFAIALCLSAVAGTALARPSTLSMTCAQAQALVEQQGAIVLSTGTYTYDRFVYHRGYCLPGEVFDREWVPAGDTPDCRLNVCKPDFPRFRMFD
jgi:hypothetical protein